MFSKLELKCFIVLTASFFYCGHSYQGNQVLCSKGGKPKKRKTGSFCCYHREAIFIEDDLTHSSFSLLWSTKKGEFMWETSEGGILWALESRKSRESAAYESEFACWEKDRRRRRLYSPNSCAPTAVVLCKATGAHHRITHFFYLTWFFLQKNTLDKIASLTSKKSLNFIKQKIQALLAVHCSATLNLCVKFK